MKMKTNLRKKSSKRREWDKMKQKKNRKKQSTINRLGNMLISQWSWRRKRREKLI